METARLLSLLMAIVFIYNITACCGSGTTTVQEKQTQISDPTLADQLQDLERAYKNGAITKEEYEKLQKDLIKKASQPK